MIKQKIILALFFSLFLAVTTVSAFSYNPYDLHDYYEIDAKYQYWKGYSDAYDSAYEMGYERGRYQFKKFTWDNPRYLPYYYGDEWYDEINYYNLLKLYKPDGKHWKKECYGRRCMWYDLHDPDDYIRYIDIKYEKGEKADTDTDTDKWCYHKYQGYYYC